MKSKIIVPSGILFGLFLGWYAFPFALYKNNEQPMQFSHQCAECHAAPLGESESEKLLVETYITPNKEIPWLVYSRQPDNAFFSHAPHVTLGEMKCENCHGGHGTSEALRTYQENRISGYSRDIWGASISGISSNTWEGMKMDRCVRCHGDNGRRDGCVACHK
ncbi:MAG: cytochrome C [Ignavibacteriales bacterium]|nr:cytochrome C [Ignavibacteriales bacterium]